MTDTKTKTPKGPQRTGDTKIKLNPETGKLDLHWPCLVIEGMQTGDGRFIPAGSLGHRGLPLPVMGQTKTGKGHDGAEVFGRITRLERVEGPSVTSKETGEPFPDGTFVWQAWGEADPDTEPGKLAMDGYLTGNSADLADTKTVEEMADENGKAIVELRGGNIAGTTLVPVPAFADGYVEVGGQGLERTPATEALVAAGVGFCGEVDDDGYPAFAAPTVDKRKAALQKGHALPGGPSGAGRYPVENAEDLAKAIRAVGRAGGASGDDAERSKVRKYIIGRARALGLSDKIPDNWAADGSLKSVTAAGIFAWRVTDPDPVVAAGGEDGDMFRPPLRLFQQRQLHGITPLTLEPQGDGTIAVFGHVADFNRPHISFTGRKVFARPSPSQYRKGFNLGALRVLDDDGTERTVAVGRLTVGGGHADLEHADGTKLSAREAKAVYDDPDKAWAWVQASDDQFGVQVNGVVIPGTPDAKVTQAYAHPPSGDWRPMDGALELVAAHSVNTAGIPVARELVASGEVQALVAAGAVAPSPSNPLVQVESIADAVIGRLDGWLSPAMLRERLGMEPADAAGDTDDAVAAEHAAALAELQAPDLFEQLGVTPSVAESLTDDEVAALVDQFDDGEPVMLELDNGTAPLDRMNPESLANWVDKAGGLPPYIRRIEKHLREKGMTESRAIATAFNVVRKMCATGDVNFPGVQSVNAGSRAEACSAAKWIAAHTGGKG